VLYRDPPSSRQDPLDRSNSLGDLAARIADAHARVVAATCSALEHARAAGDMLAEAKQRVGHLEGISFTVCNFLKGSPVRSAWSIVCNPPFDHVEEFCERALAVAIYKVAMLVPLRRLPAARWLQQSPLESVLLLKPRPSMPPGHWIEAGNTPSGGTQDFCWLIFNKFTTGGSPRLRWLNRDPKVQP
jgi:hypothetical protein